MVATLLERAVGQPVTVVNRTGGGGAVGHTAGATATPDGHTITIVTVEIAMIHWMGLAQVTPKDFAPVAQVNFDPAGVQVRAEAPWNTLKELLDDVKANPGKYKASGTGKGGIWDLARAGMLKAAGIPVDAMPWVPSEGAAPALQELVAGGVDVVTASLAEGASLIDAGRVKPLAQMGEERGAPYPEVLTLKEQGIEWVVGAWRGLALPKGAKADAVSAYEQALGGIVESAEFKEFMANNGFGVRWRNAQEFTDFMSQQDEAMGKLMKETGLTT
jgi:tripartite-type tricarboxylate transporter receptor subunit TctC